ncbi:MAG TPA: hypothetical protein VLA43_21465 [Longimicrobiales bacterium]|nr:hypothetical protein [Longimicrobiales bacterium]
MAVDTRLDQASPAGTPQLLFSLRGEHQLNNYAVTPEGDRILAIAPGEERERGAATVVLNWVSGIDLVR